MTLPAFVTSTIGRTALAAALLAAGAPALAADAGSVPAVPAIGAAPAVPLPSSAAVAHFYQTRNNAPIWFRGGPASPVAAQFVDILKRAQLDGMADGPALAAQAEAAIARAKANSAAAGEVDRLLSTMWVQYVQKLRAPVAGVVYGDKYLAPRVITPEQAMLQLSTAPSIDQHVATVATVNPIYAQLRNAAWTQVQSGAPLDSRVKANLDRTRILPAKGRYLIADIATQRLFMYQDGQLQDSMKIIVGKRDHQTPMIASTVHYATLNPYWNIPTDVVKRTVAPTVVKRGVGYLKTARYEVASDWTDNATVVPADTIDWKAVAAGDQVIRIRQLPGSGNMMGAIKFPFANEYGIYLHDTPLKGLFAKDRRTLSLGCVRIEDAKRLGRWLLQREPSTASDAPEQHVQLPTPVPIYLTYLTAHADGGQLTFGDDVYGLDGSAPAKVASAN